MLKNSVIYLFSLSLLFAVSQSLAVDNKELRKQQRAAHKERQVQVRQRGNEIKEAKSDFRDYIRELEAEYREQGRDIDTEFELKQVELMANHDMKVAEADAEFQKKLTGLFMKPGSKFDEQAIEKLQAESKIHSAELFSIKKRSAEEVHQAKIANTKRKNELYTQRDNLALEKAAELGLTKKYAPVLATPVGDTLSSKEKNWNKKEKQKVAKLMEQNRKVLSKFRNGKELRNWEIQTSHEDFELAWKEKAELHELDSDGVFYNTMMLQPILTGGQVDQQSIMATLAENNKQKKMINIEYKKLRDQEQIKRRKHRKAILSK